MDSKISRAIALKYPPVALLWSEQQPENAIQFKKQKWGCIMWLAAGAARGRTAVCDRQTFGCVGGGVGMGFGNQYQNFPGGEDCFCHFLSAGNEKWEQGRQAAEQVKPYLTKESYDNFVQGERYFKSPDAVNKFIECLPITDIPAEYVIFKPLPEIDPQEEKPRVIIFFADPDQLSALVVLANYGRGDNENLLTHAGPPIGWERMSGPMRGAVAGALIFEGRAKTYEEAEKLVLAGQIEFAPCHSYQSAGPMSGLISPSMSVYVLEDQAHDNYRAFSGLNQGYGIVLRYGAYSEEVIERRVPGHLLPVCDYLGKPFTRFSLVQHIRRAVHAWCSHRREEIRRGENIKLVLELGAMLESDED